MKEIYNECENEYRLLDNKLQALSPFTIMDKGYSINSIDGKVITDVTSVKVGDTLETKMKNGTLISTVNEVKENGK